MSKVIHVLLLTLLTLTLQLKPHKKYILTRRIYKNWGQSLTENNKLRMPYRSRYKRCNCTHMKHQTEDTLRLICHIPQQVQQLLITLTVRALIQWSTASPTSSGTLPQSHSHVGIRIFQLRAGEVCDNNIVWNVFFSEDRIFQYGQTKRTHCQMIIIWIYLYFENRLKS